MNELSLSDLQIVLPEIWLALAGMALLMVVFVALCVHCR